MLVESFNSQVFQYAQKFQKIYESNQNLFVGFVDASRVRILRHGNLMLVSVLINVDITIKQSMT